MVILSANRFPAISGENQTGSLSLLRLILPSRSGPRLTGLVFCAVMALSCRPALALETQNGDPCTAGENGWVRKTGGPENAGVSETLTCNGATWVKQSGLTGPSGCANIGDLCADGTVFAGYHPITYEHLFIPTVDQERPGAPGTFTLNWKNAAGTNDINPDSTNDGKINHANRGGAIGNFQAFQACEDLGFGGHSDWYLPSQVELYYLWSVRTTIEAAGNITNFQNNYHSSTEHSTSNSWYQTFNTHPGAQSFANKTGATTVRCLRR